MIAGNRSLTVATRINGAESCPVIWSASKSMVDSHEDRSPPPIGDEALGNELSLFVFECPACRRTIDGLTQACPRCGAALFSAYSGTYVPFRSMLAKIVSWVALILFVGSMLALMWLILSDATTRSIPADEQSSNRASAVDVTTV